MRKSNRLSADLKTVNIEKRRYPNLKIRKKFNQNIKHRLEPGETLYLKYSKTVVKSDKLVNSSQHRNKYSVRMVYMVIL